MSENPPAFPTRVERGAPLGGFEEFPGMTLRDWFAGQAAPVIWGSAVEHLAKTYGTDTEAAECVAATAYKLADAMLAERAK